MSPLQCTILCCTERTNSAHMAEPHLPFCFVAVLFRRNKTQSRLLSSYKKILILCTSSYIDRAFPSGSSIAATATAAIQMTKTTNFSYGYFPLYFAIFRELLRIFSLLQWRNLLSTLFSLF
jgi:hypothetical protein